MISLFFRTLRWAVAVTALVTSFYAANLISVTGDMKPVALLVVCAGLVFWFSKETYEASKPVFLTGIALIAFAGALSHFVIQYYIVDYVDIGYFQSWTLTLLAIGIPVMVWRFKNDD